MNIYEHIVTESVTRVSACDGRILKISEAVHCPSLVGWSRLWHLGFRRSSGPDSFWTLASWRAACDMSWHVIHVTDHLDIPQPFEKWIPVECRFWMDMFCTQIPLDRAVPSQGLAVPLTSIVSPVQRNWRSGLQPLTAAVRMWWCSATACRAFSAFWGQSERQNQRVYLGERGTLINCDVLIWWTLETFGNICSAILFSVASAVSGLISHASVSKAFDRQLVVSAIPCTGWWPAEPCGADNERQL